MNCIFEKKKTILANPQPNQLKEKAQINKIRADGGVITHFKEMQRFTRDYFENLYSPKPGMSRENR